jgi:hypothetical protein
VRPIRDGAAAVLLGSLCGCVNLHFDRELGSEPIPASRSTI